MREMEFVRNLCNNNIELETKIDLEYLLLCTTTSPETRRKAYNRMLSLIAKRDREPLQACAS